MLKQSIIFFIIIFQTFGCIPAYDTSVTISNDKENSQVSDDFDSGNNTVAVVSEADADTDLQSVKSSEPSEAKEAIQNDLKTLKNGYAAFQTGDFEKAEEIFERLSKETDNENIRLNAVYALIFVRLLTPEDDNDVYDTLYLLESWYDDISEDMKNEGPQKLGTAFSEIREKQNACKALVEKKEKNIRGLKSDLRKMKKQIKTLKNQIEALEKIHQQIQEKKKEISSP